LRRNLVFSSVGERSRHRRWLSCSGARDFDLWLCCFSNGEGYESDAEYHFRRKGSKFANFSHAFREHRDEILAYKYVFIVDDDIDMNGDAINRLFATMEEYALWEAQPAYSPDSQISHGITVCDSRFVLRYTNFCEVSVFAFRTDMLEKVVPLFDRVVSGWGVDVVIPKLLGYPRDKIAIIDSIVCSHPYRESELDNLIQREEHRREGLRLMAEQGVRLRYRIYGGVERKAGSGYTRFELFKINLGYARSKKRRSWNAFWRFVGSTLDLGAYIHLKVSALYQGLARGCRIGFCKLTGRTRNGEADMLLIITEEELWPPYHGFLARFFSLAKAIQEAGLRMVLITRKTRVNLQIEPMLKGVFDQIIYVPADRFPWNSVGSYDVEPFKKATRRVVEQLDPFAVIVEYIWLAPCLDEVGNDALKLIDAHGVVHVRNDFVFHRKILCEKWREIELLSRADVIIAIQKNDVDAFRKMVPERKVILVHHHSDVKKLEVAGEEETFAVIGDNHPPNLHALSWFLEKVWPIITRERPKAVFLVYGRMAESAPASLAIRPVGFVHDLEEAYRFARVMINPIQLGTGLKVKTVEALCYGKTLVTTSCGADGLEEGAGSAFIMEDDPAAFGRAVVRLLGDDEARRELEDGALQFAREHFSTNTAFAGLIDVLNRKKEDLYSAS